MAVVSMLKVRCVAHRSVHEALLKRLYNLGVMEAVEVEVDSRENERAVSAEALEEMDGKLRTIDETLQVLKTVSRPQRSFLEYFFTLKEPKDKASFQETLESFDAPSFCRRVLELQRTRNSLTENRKAILEDFERIEALQAFSVPLAELEVSKWTVVCLVHGPRPVAETALPKETVVLARHARGREEWALLASLRSTWPDLEQALARRNWAVLDLSDLSRTPQEELLLRREALKELKRNMERNEQALQEAASHTGDLLVAHDWLTNERERVDQTRRFTATDSTVLLQGWARASARSLLASALKSFAGSAVFSFEHPAAGEKVPIILDNPPWLEPFEFVTRMYGLPKYGEVDPTPWLAPFFLLFFSLCLTDAAYGAVLAIAAACLLRRRRLSQSARGLLTLLCYGGLVTVISGALAGGWFGNILFSLPGSLRTLGELSRKVAVFDPLENVLLFMGVAFILGYVQVCVGILIKLGHKARRGRVEDALVDEAVWLVILNGLVAWGALSAFGWGQGVIPFIKYAVAAAAFVRVLTYGRDRAWWPERVGVGLVSLYEVVGVMSDVLSYARVVALGLATGVIALVVDTLCGMTASLPWVGLVVASVIFVAGHSFNIIINVIGAFVHSGRLQFVEFFSKFFVAGGPSWRPFRFESIHFSLEG
jgi:V/A-type H+-transporting ATPase subunit I